MDQFPGQKIFLNELIDLSQVSLESALRERRSVRKFSTQALDLAQVNSLLWAAQGITNAEGHRSVPSAGALYPIELYLTAARVNGLSSGIYKYVPAASCLNSHLAGARFLPELAGAAPRKEWLASAPAALIICADYSRTMKRYGERGRLYVAMEAGHTAQNIHLMAAGLGLGTVVVGAFITEQVHKILNLPDAETALAIMPAGYADLD